MTADGVESIARLKEKKKLTFPLVHTPGGEAFKKLQVYRKDELLHGPVPLPGVMIFDRAFTLRYTEVRHSLLFRIGAKSLLRELPRLALEVVPKG